MRPGECKRTLHHVSVAGVTLVPLAVALSTALNIILKLNDIFEESKNANLAKLNIPDVLRV
jgi:hypothetical protein